MQPMQWADIKTAAAVVTSIKKSLMKYGLDAENAQKEANYIMELVSGSSNYAIRPVAFSESSLSRLMFQLKTFQLSRWDVISKTIITQGLIKGNLSQKVRALVSLEMMAMNIVSEHLIRNWYFYAQALLMGASGDDRKGKYDKKKLFTIFIFGPLGELPWLGEAVMSKIMGYPMDLSFPTLDLLNKGLAGAGSWIDGKTSETRQNGFLNMVSSFLMGIGVPGSGQASSMMKDFLKGKAEAGDAFENILKSFENRTIPPGDMLKNLPTKSFKAPSLF
jgi:hypothetical protein